MGKNDALKQHANESRLWTGIVLIIGGLVYMAYQMGAPFPAWMLTWPTAMIAFGLLIGIRNRFNNNVWFIMVILGGVLLADKIMPEIDLHNYIGPIIAIAVGLVFILRPKHNSSSRFKERWTRGIQTSVPISNTSTDGEYIDDSAFLGSMNKVILSKNFKGGEVNCVMGGAQIDLSQADIQERAVLEINQVFGGTKLIVPANWNLKIEMVAVLGGVEDKRTAQANAVDINKVLVLKGTAVFGGLEIKNF